MLDRLLELANSADYDFRKFASPADPLKYLFEEWVPYYRLKWAIARALQPQKILEIGVRFGYSAQAFLDASPNAKYLGIDNDSNSFGGEKNAIRWAQRLSLEYHADFVIADSQQMGRLPGGDYDLIHVDGQQDGTGSFHDLKLSLRQARYVLVDGYFWTRDNFLGASEFLWRYRDWIDYYLVIPGYAGELLIRTKHEGTPERAY